MSWEIYGEHEGRKGKIGNFFVRIHKGGLYLSRLVADKYEAHKFSHATLFLDKENELIAFKLTNAPIDNKAGTVNMSPSGYTGRCARSINCTSFVNEAKKLGYKVGVAYTYIVEHESMIIITKKGVK